jgi:hypothetical protein
MAFESFDFDFKDDLPRILLRAENSVVGSYLDGERW